MMIKITEKCSMGCSHCMNNALPTGKHMDFDTFKKAIAFQRQYGSPFLIISGGEPTEHPEFMKFIEYARQELYDVFITVTTNGVWMQTHEDEVRYLHGSSKQPNVMFQVSTVKEYYPTLIDLSLPVFGLPNVTVCTEIEHMYPLGRALDNNLEWDSKASKCINVRLMTHQVMFKSLRNIIAMMAVKGFFCTPHIAISGHIKLGESDLCPNCSHIDKTESEIINDILKFSCHTCDHVNCKLPQKALQILGEI